MSIFSRDRDSGEEKLCDKRGGGGETKRPKWARKELNKGGHPEKVRSKRPHYFGPLVWKSEFCVFGLWCFCVGITRIVVAMSYHSPELGLYPFCLFKSRREHPSDTLPFPAKKDFSRKSQKK